MCAVCIVPYGLHIVCIFSISVRLLNLLSFGPCSMGTKNQARPKIWHVSKCWLFCHPILLMWPWQVIHPIHHINHLTLNSLRGTEILRSFHVTPVMDGSRLILLAARPRNRSKKLQDVCCWKRLCIARMLCVCARVGGIYNDSPSMLRTSLLETFRITGFVKTSSQAWSFTLCKGFPPPRNNPSRGSLGCGLHFAPKPQNQRWFAFKMFELCELHCTRSDPAFRWQCQEAGFAVELLGSWLGVRVDVYVATKLLKTTKMWCLWGTSACERHVGSRASISNLIRLYPGKKKT